MKLNQRYLAACDMAAENDTTRPYLCGVYVKGEATKTTYVATNGHLIIRIVHNTTNEDCFEAIIASSTVKRLISLLPSMRDRRRMGSEIGYQVSAQLNDGKLLFSACTKDAPLSEIAARQVDGTFPDFERVIPKDEVYDKFEHTGRLRFGFNWAYLNDIMKACIQFKGVNRGMCALGMTFLNPTSPATLEESDGDATFTAVVMPMRV